MREAASSSNGIFPWCATALAAVCVVLSLWSAGASRPLIEKGEQALQAAEDEWRRLPYLDPGSALTARLGPAQVASAQASWEQEREANGALPMPPGVVRRQQDALDEHLAVFYAARADLPARRFGVEPMPFRWASLLFHVPIHGGVVHLLGNVALLVFFGLYLESSWGRARFAGVCAAAAAGAAFGYVLASPDTGRPYTGTSGLLAGLLPLFALYYARARSDGFYWVGLVVGGLWLLLPPLAGFQWSLDAPGAGLGAVHVPRHASFGAYAGAALCAFAAFQLLRLTGLPDFSPGGEQAPSTPDAARIEKLRASGKLDDALVQANTWVRREPDSLDAVLTLYEVAKQLGKHPAARAALLKAVRLELQAGLLAAALDHWQELASREVPREAEPALLMRLASLLEETGAHEMATRALRAALANASGAAKAVVAGRVARAARDIDAQISHDAAWQALQSAEIELEERQALEALLAGLMPRLPEQAVEAPAAPQESERPAPIDIEMSVRVLDVIDAVPLELDDDGVQIQTLDGQKKRMRYDRIEAVSVVAVLGLAEKPVLLVDLVLDWKAQAGNKLRVIRLRADRFDPRRLFPEVASPVDAMRRLVFQILTLSRGVPLPDADAARGMPFASFPEVALYQRLVLLADGPPTQSPAPAPDAEPVEKPPEQWELKG
jgi:membrane associated rhomboid family serine protease